LISFTVEFLSIVTPSLYQIGFDFVPSI